MAHFRGTIQGSRGAVSRLGGRVTGIRAKVNGWDFGVEVFGAESAGKDTFEIKLTGGSNDAERSVSLGYFTLEDLKKLQERHPTVFA